MKEYDSCSDSQLFTFASAMSPAVKLSEDCRVPSVLTGLVSKRSSDMGNRLQTFKATGGIVMGEINWKKGVYSPQFNADTHVLSGLTHISGDFVVAPSWTGQITNRWPIQKTGAIGQHISNARPRRRFRAGCYFRNPKQDHGVWTW